MVLHVYRGLLVCCLPPVFSCILFLARMLYSHRAIFHPGVLLTNFEENHVKMSLWELPPILCHPVPVHPFPSHFVQSPMN